MRGAVIFMAVHSMSDVNVSAKSPLNSPMSPLHTFFCTFPYGVVRTQLFLRLPVRCAALAQYVVRVSYTRRIGDRQVLRRERIASHYRRECTKEVQRRRSNL